MTSIYFLLGIGLTVTVWVMQRRTWSHRSRAAVVGGIAVVVGLVGFVILPARAFLGEGDVYWYDRSPMREIILLVLMMLGMGARYMTGVVEERRVRVRQLLSEGRDASNVPIRFDMWEFTYPLLFSVMTFGVLLGQLQGSGLTVPNAIISFQTGFFWQTLLKREEPAVVTAKV